MLPLKALLLIWKGVMVGFGFHIKMYKFYGCVFNIFNSLKSSISIRVLDSPIINYYYSGWPVISYVNCHKTKILQSVYHFLQPHVEESKSYFRDSTDFIKKVSTKQSTSRRSLTLPPRSRSSRKDTNKKYFINSSLRSTAQSFYK